MSHLVGDYADQQMVLTNHDGMLPTTLNDSADKAIALIQELQNSSVVEYGSCYFCDVSG